MKTKTETKTEYELSSDELKALRWFIKWCKITKNQRSRLQYINNWLEENGPQLKDTIKDYDILDACDIAKIVIENIKEN